MDIKDQNILKLIGELPNLSHEEKAPIIKTISGLQEELEQKRKTIAGQNRELEIESALEKVRARAMGMHSSDDLGDVLTVLFNQFDALGICPSFATLVLFNVQPHTFSFRCTGKAGQRVIAEQLVDIDAMDIWKSRIERYQRNEAESVQCVDYPKEMIPQLFQVFTEILSAIPVDARVAAEDFPEGMFTTEAYCQFGYLGFVHTRKATEEEKEILTRFAAEFARVYTRFLDLRKAEAQTREAQVELGLERVRARAMAMQNSEELKELIGSVFIELTKLDLVLTRCVIMIYEPKTSGSTWWMANSEAPSDPTGLFIQYHEHPPYLAYVKGWQERKLKWVYPLQGEVKKTWDDFIFSETELSLLPDFVIAGMRAPDRVYLNASFNNFGNLTLASLEPLSNEHFDILLRFAKVFDLTYTRFHDLQKAEAQAREAQIQLALERVRARTMAMQKSDELSDVAELLFKQVNDMGIKTWTTGFNIWSDDNNYYTDYITSPRGGFIDPYTIDATRFPAFKEISDAKKRGEEFYVSYLEGDLLKQTYQELSKFGDERQYEKMLEGGFQFPSRQFNHFVFGSKVSLMFITYEPVPEAHVIFKRLGKVFEQTYTRFLDLQKAEAQAREAQIEAALERIRSAAMAMHSSKDLFSVADVLREQLSHLGKKELESSIIHLYPENSPNFDVWYSYRRLNDRLGDLVKDHTSVSKNASSWTIEMMRKYYSQDEAYTIESKGKMLEDWYHVLEQHAPATVERDATGKLMVPEVLYYHFSKFSGGALLMISIQEPDEEARRLQMRAAKVFEMAYRRFKDLEKAEAQAREATIEAALERVRSRSLAMHKSEELLEAGELLFDEMSKLGIESLTAGYVLMDEEGKQGFNYTANSSTNKIPHPSIIPHNETIELQNVVANWKKQAPFYVVEMDEEETIKHQSFVANRSINFPLNADQLLAISPKKLFLHNFYFKQGYLLIVGGVRLSDKQLDIMLRFTNVFQQTYTRFLDLQKAEAQAREARIEAALEKVRSRSLAMHHSDELKEVVQVVFDKLQELDFSFYGGVFITTFVEGSKDVVSWVADRLLKKATCISIPYPEDATNHSIIVSFANARQQGVDYFAKVFSYEEKNAYFRYVFDFTNMSDEEKSMLLEKEGFTHSVALTKNTAIGVSSFDGTVLSETEAAVLKRFANVFEQSYIRFLDLKKAEAQAREARIEAALEKVRSRTMAMRDSNELSETASVLFQELKALGVVKPIDRINITIVDEEQRLATIWATKPGGEYRLKSYRLPIDELEPIKKRWDQFLKLPRQQRKERVIVTEYSGNEIMDFRAFINKYTDLMEDSIVLNVPIEKFYQHSAGFSHGSLDINGFEKLDENAQSIFKRFAVVFEQTYIRFLDLQKAEAQAREAKIEAALERVRSQTMAMHSSKDVGNAIGILFEELEDLGIVTIRCGIVIIDESKTMEAWGAIPTKEGKIGQLIGTLDMTIHPLYEGAFQAWKQKKPVYTYELRGKDFIDYYNIVTKSTNYKIPARYDNAETHICNFFIFKEGGLFTFTKEPLGTETRLVLEKFTGVFALTYRRYLDLKQAEEQSRQVVVQASLDRVRAEIASMRTTNDLETITPLIWKELTTLKVPFIRCGVFIMDDAQQKVHTYLSTPKGKGIAAFDIPYDAKGNIAEVIRHWREKKSYTDRWDEKTFTEFAENLVQQGAISSSEEYFSSLPGSTVFLHFLPFLQGMLYVGNIEEFTEDNIKLVQSLADAFSTAYARYEDFNKLEAAKRQMELTLTELRSTQAQLVQKEKMASLGELTAGVAHEIQNPLNFVNNFSEVNKELIEELKGQRSKMNGQRDEALEDELLNDIAANEQKINYHGKRADAIVKGMLQHSRTSAGKKEPTDINALADEYLRLSYHGLRAKNQSFNVAFHTDFDAGIGKIDIIPQDIGRVLLNLFNNAFYAAFLPSGRGFDKKAEPAVWVTTKKDGEKVIISVKDNGPGIPSNIVDKIFQPFFTTKPTGQGTGLGLSLSYDIVKAHGGEIKVESVEREGSDFIIELPME